MEFNLGDRIKKLEDLHEGDGYFIDNELHQLMFKDENRYVFHTMLGTYVANKAMMEQHMIAGIFTLKVS